MESEYRDIDGHPVSLDKLCRVEPAWAANNIRRLRIECGRLREALRERCDAAERKRCTECNGARNYEVDRKNGIPQHQDWCWVPGGRALLAVKSTGHPAEPREPREHDCQTYEKCKRDGCKTCCTCGLPMWRPTREPGEAMNESEKNE